MITQRLEYTDREYKYYHILNTTSKLTTCGNRQVAALVVDKDAELYGIGYNSVIHCNNLCDKTCNVRHAEIMALQFIPHTRVRMFTLYVNLFPCEACQKEASLHGVGKIIVFGDRGNKRDTELVDIEIIPDMADVLLRYNGRDGRNGPRNCRQIFQGEMSELSTAISNYDARDDREEHKSALMDDMIEESVDVDLQHMIFNKTIWPEKEKGEGSHKWNKLLAKFRGYILPI